MRPAAVEFLVHMSLCAAVASVNSLSTDGLIDRGGAVGGIKAGLSSSGSRQAGSSISQSDHAGARAPGRSAPAIRHQRVDHTSITGARLDLQWRQLSNVEYLTDGGNSWIHTAVFNGKPVVVKTLKPECQDVAVAINEIEGELGKFVVGAHCSSSQVFRDTIPHTNPCMRANRTTIIQCFSSTAIHSRLNHPNIVSLVGAGLTSKGVRFIVLERLDGGTLTQRLGYDTRIRDRRRRFWRKKQLAYLDVLRCSRSIASAMQYCHEQAIPKSVVLHRDLKPDNICFSLDGAVKLIDFGLARVLENADPTSNEVYDMSGETGSLRYMSPECAEGLRYNHKSDVYSFGIILWELNSGKKPFVGLNRELFYERVVHGGERPPMNKKWPSELCKLITDCWSDDIETRPTFGEVVERIENLLSKEQEGAKNKGTLRRLSGIIDRHSTWF
jgi:serine/threonine protein kinase